MRWIAPICAYACYAVSNAPMARCLGIAESTYLILRQRRVFPIALYAADGRRCCAPSERAKSTIWPS